jgi:formate C-acetyltransferase
MQAEIKKDIALPEFTVQEIHPKNQIQKDRLLTADHWLCMERAKFYTDSYKQTEGENPSIRAAKALKHTFENMTLQIYPEELLVGNRASQDIAPPIAPERGDITLFIRYLFSVLKKRYGYHITKEHRKWLTKEIYPYWQGKSVRDLKVPLFEEHNLSSKLTIGNGGLKRIRKSFGLKHIGKLVVDPNANFFDKVKFIFQLPKYIKMMKAGTADNVKGRGRCTDAQAHIVPGYKKVLKIGFKGIKEKAENRLKTAKNDSEKAFLEAVIMTCETMRDFSLRFTKLAKELASKESDEERKTELLKIAENSEKVPWNGSETFYEAVQSFWFTQNAIIISYGAGSGITPGRMDQILYPYYKKSKDSNLITDDEVLRLLEEFIIKINNNVVIWPNIAGVRLNHLGSDVQTFTFSGVDRKGEDATNELTYIFIEAVKNTKIATQSSFRISKKSPEEYVKKVLELHKYTNGPAMFNDEVIIESMQKDGYSLEAARDYCIVGCVEPSGSGDTYGATGGTKLYFPSVLDLIINRGITTFFGGEPDIDTGDPVEFKSFDEFMDKYYTQLERVVDVCATAGDLRDQVWAENFHNPLISCTIDGCIENAKDETQGGAEFMFQAIGGAGLGTIVDSLAAIKKFVYDEKSVSMRDLIDAIHTNFKENEPLRQILMNGPKYGVDDDYADSIAVELMKKFCAMVKSKKLSMGNHFRPSFSSYGLNVYEGALEPATPDGRKSGEAISNGISPSNGAEILGPTAALNSVAKIDHTDVGYGEALNMRFPPFLTDNDKGLETFKNLLETYFEQGGFHLQVNNMGTDVLMDAQLHPENHTDLIVRVSGYAAYFTRLGKEIQDDLIDRIEFCDCF